MGVYKKKVTMEEMSKNINVWVLELRHRMLVYSFL